MHSAEQIGNYFAECLQYMVRHGPSLDSWIMQERVLYHRLESPPRVPVPAACTPLEIDQYASEPVVFYWRADDECTKIAIHAMAT